MTRSLQDYAVVRMQNLSLTLRKHLKLLMSNQECCLLACVGSGQHEPRKGDACLEYFLLRYLGTKGIVRTYKPLWTHVVELTSIWEIAKNAYRHGTDRCSCIDGVEAFWYVSMSFEIELGHKSRGCNH